MLTQPQDASTRRERTINRWGWGQEIGPADETTGAADRIVHVLRAVQA
ncbi:hypothetical protein [Actinomadura darangshiensis]|nr:hypothetical protein [Actinomadura darangshiensis]